MGCLHEYSFNFRMIDRIIGTSVSLIRNTSLCCGLGHWLWGSFKMVDYVFTNPEISSLTMAIFSTCVWLIQIIVIQTNLIIH